MNTDEMQHQDELEKQERLLSILDDMWTYTETKQEEDDILYLASALGLSKEFKQIIGE
jgi:hypothetical protein